MEDKEILAVVNDHYSLHIDRLEFLRDSGSVAYAAYSNEGKYFLRITKPAFHDTVLPSLDIHVFLLTQGFPVPPIIWTKEHSPYVRIGGKEGERFYILYAFIEGGEVDPEQDAEKIGALIGNFHHIMKAYPNALVKHDKPFYIDRYIEILRTKQYPEAARFAEYGDALWERVKDLPRGYSHGDMYRGNFHKTPDGTIYVLDFDTSCLGFPLYDPVLICNMTNYFEWEEDGYQKSKKVFDRFLPEYRKYNPLSEREAQSFFDMIALYHFALQATIIELFGLDCVDNAFFDRQLDWLMRWRDQCERYASEGR